MARENVSERVELSVTFHDQDVFLRIARRRYERILRGHADSVRGEPLHHEEEGRQTTKWHFAGGQQGKLIVLYGHGGGQAFVGCLDDAHVRTVAGKADRTSPKARLR